MNFYQITPRDPVIARDGRPFGNGLRMRSLNWFYPSVITGAFRTLYGKQKNFDFKDENKIAELKKIIVRGPLPALDNKIYFPRPLDCIKNKEKNKLYVSRPETINQDEGTDLPDGIIPCMLQNAEDNFKPGKISAFWNSDLMFEWLFNTGIPSNFSLSEEKTLDFPEQDIRTHIKMKMNENVAEEGMLFQTTGLDFNVKDKNCKLRIAVSASEKIEPGIDTLGGERRIVYWENSDNDKQWQCPDNVRNALKNSKKIRMVAATPALFENGWKPGWINKDLTGCPPGSDVKLKLVSAVVDRWMPVSGWSYETNRPKGIRRLVPVGSVYFFEVIGGNAENLSSLWLQSVCDQEQYRNDGFGLVVWGIY